MNAVVGNQAIAALTRFPGVWRGGELERVVHPTVPTGHVALDRELPGGGWPMGTLSEVLHAGVGIGEVGFLAGAIARACDSNRLVAWINAPHLPYAPALAQSGIPLDRCLVVRPSSSEDALWSAEQALKSGACGAVLLWLQGIKNQYAWPFTFAARPTKSSPHPPTCVSSRCVKGASSRYASPSAVGLRSLPRSQSIRASSRCADRSAWKLPACRCRR